MFKLKVRYLLELNSATCKKHHIQTRSSPIFTLNILFILSRFTTSFQTNSQHTPHPINIPCLSKSSFICIKHSKNWMPTPSKRNQKQELIKQKHKNGIHFSTIRNLIGGAICCYFPPYLLPFFILRTCTGGP